jgi:hypothetical protein
MRLQNLPPFTTKKSLKIQRALYVILTFLLIGTNVNASVSAYSFTSTSGTYTPISGTTFLSGTWDDASSSLLSLPFTFTYNGTAYTSVGINSNGFITLGAVPGTVYCGLQSSAFNSIAGYGTDLINGSASSTIIYTTSGTAPNRQFIVQWTDVDHFNNGRQNHWSFQIILNETSNVIQVVWGPSTDITTTGANGCTDVATESGNVGLLGSARTDYNVRSVTNGSETWSSSISGSTINAVCNMSATNIPANGLTYTWIPAVPAVMAFNSCTTTFLNNAQTVSVNTSNNPILQVQVNVTGAISPFTVTDLTLTTSGCTNPATDISTAKIYFTGTSNAFSTTTGFGSGMSNPNGTYTINGTAVLSEGINYFWIAYDIKNSATINNLLSGCCTQIIGTGTMGTRVPSITCPVGSQSVSSFGAWTQLVNSAPAASGGLMLLLSDGTVMAKSSTGGGDGVGNVWNKLTPDIHGSYVNGTWSPLASMYCTRLYFSSQLLKDGRVYVAGGEYGTGKDSAEVYNPLTNTWTRTANVPGATVSDANSEILSDGRILQALVAGTLKSTSIYNPVTNTFSAGPTALGIHNESAWVKLADNSVLYIDRLSTASERYIPATNTWVADGTVPVQLYDAFGDEAGGAILLPDGRAFFLGSSGHTAYYTPSGTVSPGIWTAGPDIPGSRGTPDAPSAMMVNGKILCTVSPVPTSANHFPSPSYVYEFNYLTNTFTLVNAPGGGSSLSGATYTNNMLDLPDGTILFNNQGSTQYYVYAPAGTPLAAGKPTIANVSSTGCTTYKITGTQFNGISQGASYGDDWQMSTNYPIVRLTSGANVYYARTFNWNTTGVQRGAAADTVSFTLPAGLPTGTYSLMVVANGISSDPVSFNTLPTLSSTLTPSPICTNTAFTYTPASTTGGATFTWTRAAVPGISNAAITSAQSSNPNEVLINTTSNPINVVYSYLINGSGCVANTQTVTVVVNPLPLASVISAGGSTTFCSGSSISLSGNSTGGTWSIAGGTTSSISASSSGDYFVTTTNSCGSTTSNHIIVTVNPNVNWYNDADGDGYYTGSILSTCSSPGAGYVTSVLGAGDCDNSNAAVHPGATEICNNGLDDNCNGTIDEGCNIITLNVKMILQGYYSRSLGSMTEGFIPGNIDPTAVDTITIELHHATAPYALAATAKGILHTNNLVAVAYPIPLIGLTNSYYLVIHHRNSVETWSKNPVPFNAVNINFDFTQ